MSIYTIVIFLCEERRFVYYVSRFRIYPDQTTRTYFAKNFGCVRWVYNDALAYCIAHYEHNRALPKDKQEKRPSAYDLSRRLTQRKSEYPWLHEADSQALKVTLKNLDGAFKSFFRRVKQGQKPGFPKWKNRSSKKSFTCTGICAVDFVSKRLKIPKCAPIRLRGGVAHPGKIQRVTISQVASEKYFASVLFKDDLAEPEIKPLAKAEELVSVDVGIDKLVHVDDGCRIKKIDLLDHLMVLNKHLVRAQKRLARCQNGSANRHKAKLRVARAHEKIVNYRNHIHHLVANEIVNTAEGVVVEDLDIKNLIKKIAPVSADEKTYLPNGRSRQKRNNQRIMLSAWGRLIDKLLYKSQRHGKPCLLVDSTVGPNKICSHCLHYEESVHHGMTHWTCSQCRACHNRHENCLINLRRIGFAMHSEAVGKTETDNTLT